MRRRPNGRELRERIRKWLRYYIRIGRVSRPRITQSDIADAIGVSGPMVSLLKDGKEDPGLDTFVGMHFGLGANMERMVRSDPPSEEDEPTLPTLRLPALK